MTALTSCRFQYCDWGQTWDPRKPRQASKHLQMTTRQHILLLLEVWWTKACRFDFLWVSVSGCRGQDLRKDPPLIPRSKCERRSLKAHYRNFLNSGPSYIWIIICEEWFFLSATAVAKKKNLFWIHFDLLAVYDTLLCTEKCSDNIGHGYEAGRQEVMCFLAQSRMP